MWVHFFPKQRMSRQWIIRIKIRNVLIRWYEGSLVCSKSQIANKSGVFLPTVFQKIGMPECAKANIIFNLEDNICVLLILLLYI